MILLMHLEDRFTVKPSYFLERLDIFLKKKKEKTKKGKP